jgi:hypothetical protein
MVDEPYLMGMCKMVMKLRWKSGLSGFHENEPDGGGAKFLTLILEQRKPPTSQTWILAMFLQYGGFDFFSDFAMYLVWSTGEILIGVICLVAGLPVIEGGTWHIILSFNSNNRYTLSFQRQQIVYLFRLVHVL